MRKIRQIVPRQIRYRNNKNRKDNLDLHRFYLPIRQRIISHMAINGITYGALAQLLCKDSKNYRAYGECAVKEGGFISLYNICKALGLKLKVSIE